MDRDEIVGTILIDLSKAFDSIDHNLLVAKLEAYGVRGNEKEWFLNYLTDRQQSVVVGEAKSTWSEMVKGVPQGSSLGPLLFAIFMNDLPSVIENCNVNLYADDTTIYFSSKDPQEVQDVLRVSIMQLTGQNRFTRSLSGGYKMTNGSVHKLFFKDRRSHQRKRSS